MAASREVHFEHFFEGRFEIMLGNFEPKRLTTAPFPDENVIIGRRRTVVGIFKKLLERTSDERPAVIALSAPPGFGKSAVLDFLARMCLSVHQKIPHQLPNAFVKEAIDGNRQRLEQCSKFVPVPISFNNSTCITAFECERFLQLHKEGKTAELDEAIGSCIAVRAMYAVWGCFVNDHFKDFRLQWDALENKPSLQDVLETIK